MKALVLSSGGCDSTCCLALAVRDHGAENVASVSFDYGQRHGKELACAEAVARHYGVAHHVIDLTGSHIMDASASTLLAHTPEPVSHGSYAEQVAADELGIVATYVPYRNGLFLSAAASLALSLWPHEPSVLYIGIHADDVAGAAYPDCTPEFVETIGRAITLGSYGLVHVRAPHVALDKAGVVRAGIALGAPFELTWSCYEGGQAQCGECATCRDRRAAFEACGVADPVPYRHA